MSRELLGTYHIGFYLPRGVDVKDYYTQDVTMDDEGDGDVFYCTQPYYNDYYHGKMIHKAAEIILRDSSKYDFTEKFKDEISIEDIHLIDA